MGVNDTSSSSSKISLEIFQEIFKKIEPDIQVESYEVR